MTERSKRNYDHHQDLEAYYIKIAKSSSPAYAFAGSRPSREEIDAVPQKSSRVENSQFDREGADYGGTRVE